MFGDLTAAFALTVFLCLAPSLLVSLGVAPIILRFSRPKAKPNAKPGDVPKRGFLGNLTALAMFYFMSLIVLVMASIIFWWGFIALSGREAAIDFAAQSLPIEVEQELLDSVIEPTATP